MFIHIYGNFIIYHVQNQILRRVKFFKHKIQITFSKQGIIL